MNGGSDCVKDRSCSIINPPIALTTDERGANRVGVTDIGAFELNNSINGGTFVAELPNASSNTPYSFVILPNNMEFTYTISSGALPMGVNLTANFAPSAVIALMGTPAQSGTFNFAVTGTDGTNSNVTNYRLQVLAPTAASVSISGRVITPQEFGLTSAFVILTDSQGNSQTVRSGKFGNFRFADVTAGETYIISIQSKRYTYATQIVTVNEDLTNLTFTPQ